MTSSVLRPCLSLFLLTARHPHPGDDALLHPGMPHLLWSCLLAGHRAIVHNGGVRLVPVHSRNGGGGMRVSNDRGVGRPGPQAGVATTRAASCPVASVGRGPHLFWPAAPLAVHTGSPLHHLRTDWEHNHGRARLLARAGGALPI